jgi:hypothetical protein
MQEKFATGFNDAVRNALMDATHNLKQREERQ